MSATSDTATRYATYKGRRYRLEYLGPTKYGRRAKLAFLDGSKSFWADADHVTETGAPAGGARGRRRSEDDECEACGGNKWTCGHCVGW